VTLFVDSSALVKRYLGHERVLSEMAADDVWCASGITRTEVALALSRLAVSRGQAERFETMVAADWETFHVVPVDERCLRGAAVIGANFGLRVPHAIQLAAADRLPRPVRFLTLDDRQIPAAVALDLEVVAWEG
jgi:hypothetical protein